MGWNTSSQSPSREEEPGSPRSAPARSDESELGRGAVIGVGAVACGTITACLEMALLRHWELLDLLTEGSLSIASGARTLALLAIPCALVAWLLATWSLQRSRGAYLAERIVSLVKWTTLAPLGWGIMSTASSVLVNGDVKALLEMEFVATLVAVAAWWISLTPVWVALVGWGYLCCEGRRRRRLGLVGA